MSTTWITSDLHLYHKNIITYCDRPYDNEYDMNAGIVSAWNSDVNDGDNVIVVGDLSAGVAGRQDDLAALRIRLNG
jgi:calcineurin-like phosphoesterase family protein